MRDPQRYTVLVDGYNVIKRHPSWERLPLREARQHLIELLTHTRWPVPAPCVLVVFDTRGPSEAYQPTAHLRVHFAAPSADAYIQEAIRNSPSASCLLVISNDGEILRTAKSHGARRYPTQWLFAHQPARTHRPDADGEADARALPARSARHITEELAKRWLDSSNV